MKKRTLFATLIGIMVWCFSATAQETSDPEITFESVEYAFGEIKQGDKVNHTFEFENTGGSPLVISNVSTTCGCTVPQWPREPIAPGQKGKIDVVFNSAGKLGRQNKVITIYANVEKGLASIKLTGNVTKD